jgi:hypothetical protein
MTSPPGPWSPPSQPSPGQAAQGTIRLTIQGSELTTNLVAPTLRVNGWPVASRYGTQDLPVWAGRNHLDLETQWMRTYGQAGLDVDVAPGQVVQVWYAAPFHQFARGAIGLEKQRRPGAGFLWGLLAVVVVTVVLVVAGSLAG